MTRTAAVLCLAAVLAGCGSGSSPASPTATVEIFGPYQGAEADRFVESLQRFEDRTGIGVHYTGTGDFVEDLETRTGETNDPPDIAIVPQPGLVRALHEADRLVALDPGTRQALGDTTSERVRAFGEIDGEPVGVPFRVTVKSLVWYRPSVFEAHDWTPPTTLAELERLVRAIGDSELTAPWCLGTEAGKASGWPATDWVEDLLLREAGVGRYDAWAQGELAFASPEVEGAYARFEDLVLTDQRVLNGRSAAADTRFDESGPQLFDDPPGCALFKQADFAVTWLDEADDGQAADDLDFFVLPGATDSQPDPLVVGGDLAVAFSDRPDVAALMAFLAGPDGGATWVSAGGFLSPKSSTALTDYPAGPDRTIAALLTDGRTVAFDASDSMPPQVGSGLLWTQTNQWVAGALPYADLATTIDAALAAASQ